MITVDKLILRTELDPKTGCLNWNGSIDPNGYGAINVKNKKWGVHRFMMSLLQGKIENDLQVCHHCDNRKCINPDHLFIGTRSDNMQDAKRKGRLANNRGKVMKTHLQWRTSDGKKICKYCGVIEGTVKFHTEEYMCIQCVWIVRMKRKHK